MTPLKIHPAAATYGGYMLKLLTMLFLIVPALSLASPKKIKLKVGKTEQIKLNAFAKEINLNKDKVVKIHRGSDNSVLLVEAVGKGSVAMEVIKENGEKDTFDIDISPKSSQGAIIAAIKEKLSLISTLKIRTYKGKLYLSGNIRQASSVALIQSLKKKYPGVIVDGTERSVSRPAIVVESINRSLRKNGINSVQARSYGRYIHLVGGARDKLERDLSMKLAKTIDSRVIDSMSEEVKTAPSVKIDVMFVEVSKSDKTRFGLKGEPLPDASTSLATGVLALKNGHTGPISWQVSDLNFFLEMIKTSGRSRVLSQPTLVSRSGEKSKFHSGGTFYMESVQNVDGKKEIVVTPIDHGIELEIESHSDHLGQISAKIKTSVKDIVEAKIEGGLPSLAVNKVDTSVTIKDGQSILLSGLTKKRETKEMSKVPGLGDIPVVGEMFKSRKFESEEVELVVLVTMSLTNPSNDNVSAAKGIWDHAGRDVKFNIFD